MSKCQREILAKMMNNYLHSMSPKNQVHSVPKF